MTTTERYTITDFIADVKQLVPADGSDPGPAGREAVGELLVRLARDPEILARTGQQTERRGTHGIDIRGGELYKEPDRTLTLMLARFPHEAETPIHNHHSWGVVAVVSGRDRYLAWKRLDDGSRPGYAEVELAFERTIDPGEMVHFAAPPGDIHSQQGADGAPVWELVFFGKDPNIEPRLYFDREARTVTAAQARRG